MKIGKTCPNCNSFVKLYFLPRHSTDFLSPFRFKCHDCHSWLRFKELYDVKFFSFVLIFLGSAFCVGYFFVSIFTQLFMERFNFTSTQAFALEMILIGLPIAIGLSLAFIFFLIKFYAIEIVQQK